MALSASRVVKFAGTPERAPAVEAVGNDTYYKGAILTKDGDGYAAVPTDAALQFPCGIFTGKDDTGRSEGDLDVASGKHPKLEFETGKVWLPLSGAAQSDKGEVAYISDDEGLTQTAGSKTIGFEIEDIGTDEVLIDLRKPIKMA